MGEADKPFRERRRSQRSRLSALGALNLEEGRTIGVQLWDVSLGGCLIRVEEQVSCGQGPWLIRIPFGRDPEEAILVRVKAVDVSGHWMRIKWDQALPPEDWVKLLRLMERRRERRFPLLETDSSARAV